MACSFAPVFTPDIAPDIKPTGKKLPLIDSDEPIIVRTTVMRGRWVLGRRTKTLSKKEYAEGLGNKWCHQYGVPCLH